MDLNQIAMDLIFSKAEKGHEVATKIAAGLNENHVDRITSLIALTSVICGSFDQMIKESWKTNPLLLSNVSILAEYFIKVIDVHVNQTISNLEQKRGIA